MAASKKNLPIIEKGVTFDYSITWNNPDGTPKNLTGCTAKIQFREDLASTTTILELTTENGMITITPLLGKIDILIPDDVTLAITASSGVYDILIYFADGTTRRLLEGKVTFVQTVTR